MINPKLRLNLKVWLSFSAGSAACSEADVGFESTIDSLLKVHAGSHPGRGAIFQSTSEGSGRADPNTVDSLERDGLRIAALTRWANLAQPADLSGIFPSCGEKNNRPLTMFPQKGFTCAR
jgi:hypothetical protein